MARQGEGGPLAIGSLFLDKYEIKGLLGQGGQAWVYRGEHKFTGRSAAIKVIHSPYGVTEEMLARATAEAKALGKLDHPNIVVMYDAGVTHEGMLYIVMELLRGCSLRTVLAEHGRLNVDEVLRLGIFAGEGIQAAHANQMIHRDLKPDNLFVIRGTGGNGIKVLDFGIAKMMDEIGFKTHKDRVVGTMHYMSPEQTRGLSLTTQSDIYALGLVLFEALIGKRPGVLIFEQELIERGAPYRRPSAEDLLAIQVDKIPPLVSKLDPSIPINVAHLVQRSIAKVARQRFATMRDFVAAMRGCLEAYEREVPLGLRGPSGRDLTLPAPKASDLPVSQRPTAKRSVTVSPASAQAISAQITAPAGRRDGSENGELLRQVPAARVLEVAVPGPSVDLGIQTAPLGSNGVSSQPPATLKLEPPARSEPSEAPAINVPVAAARATKAIQRAPAKQKLLPFGPIRPATVPPVTVNSRSVGTDIARKNKFIVGAAVIGGSICGIAAMLRFSPLSHAANQPARSAISAVSAPANPDAALAPSTAASATAGAEDPSLAEPPPVAAIPNPASLPASVAHPVSRVAPAPHAIAKPVENTQQRVGQLELWGGSPTPSARPAPTSASTPPVKRSIY